MAIQLFDTLTRTQKPVCSQEDAPLRFYCCGPTVYGPAHIGNFRTFLLQDVLRRTLEVAEVEVMHVRNITDVDDKTIRQSQAEGASLSEFTEKWTQKFHEDCEALNMLKPSVEPKATEHIQEQITIIEQLIENGHAYQAADGSVYFKVSSCGHYGELANLDVDELQTQSENSAGAANDADEYDRESVSDFALWKAHKPEDGDNSWDSPWGKGRPGWHVECSAMSTKYLGNSFDLHGGGVDLCFPHHENEIAQSECATGERPFCKHWFHSAHLMINGQKMSKSLGNFFTLSDVQATGLTPKNTEQPTAQEKRGFSPMVLRYALIAGHYRQQLNITDNGLLAAESALKKLEKGVQKLLSLINIDEATFRTFIQPTPLATTGAFEPAWQALAEDLNIPACLGEIFTALKNLDDPDFSKVALGGQIEALGGLLYALGLDLFIEGNSLELSIPPEIQELAEKRWQAKLEKNWTLSDQLRDEVTAQGWQVFDRKDGYDLKKG